MFERLLSVPVPASALRPWRPGRPSAVAAALGLAVSLGASPAAALPFVETLVMAVAGQSTCATFSSPAPIVSFFGSTGVSVPSAGLAPCNVLGAVDHTTASAGPLSDSQSLSTPVAAGNGAGAFDGSAAANANFGQVGARATASFTGASDGFTVVGAAAYGMFSDSFTFAPDPLHPLGTIGQAIFSFTVDGSLSVGNLATPTATFADLWVNYRQNVGPIFTGLVAGANITGPGNVSPAFVTLPSGGTSSFAQTPTSLTGSAVFDTFVLSFLYGTPFDLTLGLLSTVQPRTAGVANVDFLTSATLSGIRIFSGGQAVSSFTIASGSGTGYNAGGVVRTSPVDEPGGLVLLVGGLAVAGLAGRARRRRSGGALPAPGRDRAPA